MDTLRSLHESIRAKLGNRGEVLLVAGIMAVALGLRYIVAPVIRLPGTFIIHELIPIPWWGLAWIAAGAVALAFCPVRTPGRDRWGFAALMLMFSLQTASYLASWGLHLFGYAGDPRGVYSAILLVGFARILAVNSRWSEPRFNARDLRAPENPTPPEAP